MNNDGFGDILTSNFSSGDISIALGVGGGAFGPTLSLPVAGSPGRFSVADLNNDGRQDLAVSNVAGDQVLIFLGVGDGSFTVGMHMTLPVGRLVADIASADMNADSNNDLAIVISNSQGAPSSTTVSVCLGDGAGGFGPPLDTEVGTSPSSLVTADFNQDGRVDLAVANERSNNVSVFVRPG